MNTTMQLLKMPRTFRQAEGAESCPVPSLYSAAHGLCQNSQIRITIMIKH